MRRGRTAPSSTLPTPTPLERARRAVVERAAQGAGLGERLDAGDHACQGTCAPGRRTAIARVGYGRPPMAIDFESEGLLEGLDGDAREARLELLEKLADDGVPLDELRAATERQGAWRCVPVERVLGGRLPRATAPRRSRTEVGRASASSSTGSGGRWAWPGPPPARPRSRRRTSRRRNA